MICKMSCVIYDLLHVFLFRALTGKRKTSNEVATKEKGAGEARVASGSR